MGNGEWRNQGKSIATDSAGFVYVGGSIEGPLWFIDTLIPSDYDSRGFIAKLTPAGGLVWFKWYMGSNEVTSLCFDHNNDLCAVGIYYNRVYFEDTILVSNNTDSIYSSNMFIVKYDTAGDLLWAKSTGGCSYPAPLGDIPYKKITVDNDNNLVITGKCIEEIAYFDTTAFVNSLDSVWEQFYGWQYFHRSVGFIAKYNPDGQKIWVKKMGNKLCFPFSVKTDNSNNIVVTGTFDDSATFDTILINPTGTTSVFLVKYNTNGNIIWGTMAGGTSNGNDGLDIAVDSVNNIYFTGQVAGNNIQFDSVIYSQNSRGFLAKYNPSGDLVWLKLLYSETGDGTGGLSLEVKQNDVFIAGYFMDTLVLGNITLTSAGGWHDMFLIKYDLNGDVLQAGQYCDYSKWLYAVDMCLDNNNNIYITGVKQHTALEYDILIARIDSDLPVHIIENVSSNTYLVYPNPSYGIVNIVAENGTDENYLAELYTISGTLVYTGTLKEQNNSIDLSYLSSGVYLLQIRNNNKLSNQKLIINKNP